MTLVVLCVQTESQETSHNSTTDHVTMQQFKTEIIRKLTDIKQDVIEVFGYIFCNVRIQ